MVCHSDSFSSFKMSSHSIKTTAARLYGPRRLTNQCHSLKVRARPSWSQISWHLSAAACMIVMSPSILSSLFLFLLTSLHCLQGSTHYLQSQKETWQIFKHWRNSSHKSILPLTYSKAYSKGTSKGCSFLTMHQAVKPAAGLKDIMW